MLKINRFAWPDPPFKVDEISHSGGGRGRPGRPDEPFLFSSFLFLHGPDSDFLSGDGLYIGVYEGKETIITSQETL